MGMLMHHTWLKQQKAKQPVKETRAVEKTAEEKVSEPVEEKKPVGRRKTRK